MKNHISGLSKEFTKDLEERVSEFEREHENDLSHGGSGWVPRIRGIDYLIAICLNAIITIWLIIILISS